MSIESGDKESLSEAQKLPRKPVHKYFGKIKTVMFYGLAFLLISHAVDFYRLSQRESLQIDKQLLNQLANTLSSPQLQSFESGEPMLIYVWASWCGVCLTTSRAVSNIAKDYPVATLALNSGNQVKINQYLKQKDYNFPFIVDEQGSWMERLQARATPSFFIVNNEAQLLYYSVGINTEPGLRAKLAVYRNSHSHR